MTGRIEQEGISGLPRNNSWNRHIIEQIKQYGILALIILLFTGWNAFIMWNTERYIDRSDQQATANEKIGILEGQMQSLQQQKDASTKVCPTATITLTPTR